MKSIMQVLEVTQARPKAAGWRAAALLSVLFGATAAVQAGPVAGQGSWQTTLQARDLDGNAANGAEAFYDTALNITWLRVGSESRMSWAGAKAWAENGDFFGLKGWRLPTTQVTTVDGSCDWSPTGGTSCGYNPDHSLATGSEMAHLFFKSLGNKSAYLPGTTLLQESWGLTNTGHFQNLLPGNYWSDTEYALGPSVAWFFGTDSGQQYLYTKNSVLLALAVRPGDVGTAVPEPQTLALTLAAIAALTFTRRRGNCSSRYAPLP